jgi:lipid-A-disaccharide synthase
VKRILLLPGSRKGEVRRHVPVMLDALKLIQKRFPEAQGKMILPTQTLADIAKSSGTTLEIQIGGLWQALSESDIAITKTGTVTLECALFGVPAVTMYKAFWGTYQLGKRIVKVNSLTMPNLMAKEEVFPEFIQDAATPENISRVALELLENESVRKRIKTKLAEVVAMLGGPGASQRAARAITDLLEPKRGERIRG